MPGHECKKEGVLGSMGTEISHLKEEDTRIEKRIDGAFGKIKEHTDDSQKYRKQVQEHEIVLKGVDKAKTFIEGSALVLILSIIALAVTWGELNYKVDRLEKMHPILPSAMAAENGNGK
jgi:hypothetical protein